MQQNLPLFCFDFYILPVELGLPLKLEPASPALDVVENLLVDVVDVLLEGGAAREPLATVLAVGVEEILVADHLTSDNISTPRLLRGRWDERRRFLTEHSTPVNLFVSREKKMK